jgi:hypothetical protein
MTRAVSKKNGGPVLDGLYQQLLKRGVQYFLPSSHLEVVGQARPSTPEVVFHTTSGAGLSFEWLGDKYTLTNHKEFSDHELKLVRSIGRFLSTRYELLFDGEAGARNMPISAASLRSLCLTFLDARVFGDAWSAQGFACLSTHRGPSRQRASSYEDKRISTGALLLELPST